MTRRLTREDRELWAAVRRTARPLRSRRGAGPDPDPAVAEAASASPAAPPAAAPISVPPPQPGGPPRAKPSLKPLADLDGRARRRLAAGRTEVDGRIDLHGFTEERAHLALIGFLRASRLRGARVVLVITGKGGDRGGGESGGARSADPAARPRGILRHLVPHWLARSDLRDLVLGFEPAGPRHGGAGALYVRLRRAREPRT